jgi:regulator of sigma E protease
MENIIYAIISALLALAILIVIHELGHFLLAKRTKVGVLTFSIGFGPKLLGRRIGETDYVLSAFPLGGYVKMVGEDPDEEVKGVDVEKSFSHQGLGKRVLIVAAGPVFNLFLAAVIFSSIFLFFGRPVLTPEGMPILTTRLGSVEGDSPAAKAGVKKGDRIIAVDGQLIKEWGEIASLIKESGGKALKLRLERDSREIEITLQPVRKKREDIKGEKLEVWAIGIGSELTMEKIPPWEAVWQGFSRTGEYSVFTLVALFKMATGDLSPKNLGGPILIAQVAGRQAQEGLASFFHFVAILSVNLGVLNLLPIPVLDGGHLFFFLLEGILGRPVQVKHRERAQQVGIFILILVMIFAFYNDISRLFEG